MRRFEERYRINEGDDVLNRENDIHQDVDLRLDAVEQDAEAFRAGNRADTDAILASLERTFGALAAEMRSLLDQASGGLSADIITETATRLFLTADRAVAIQDEAVATIRAGVAVGGDTLAKVYTLTMAAAATANANAAALNALTTGADPLIDTFAEIAAKFTSQGSALSDVMAAIGNRLRGDAAANYGTGFRDQFRANLGGAVPAAISASTPLTLLDTGRDISATGTVTITAPAAYPGSRTGVITNGNVFAGLVTLAVPAGATLDDVLNGTTVLKPYQKARIIQTGSNAYATEWVDRTPLIALREIRSAVASVSAPLPAGYTDFDIDMANVSVSAAAGPLLRLSPDNGATFYSAADSYYYSHIVSDSSGTAVVTQFGTFTGFPTITVPAGGTVRGFRGQFTQGSAAGTRPWLQFLASAMNSSANTITRAGVSRFETGVVASAIQLSAPGANLTGGVLTVRGRA